MGRWKRLLNFVSFQVGWFACALGAAKGLPFAGPVVVAVLLGLQMRLVPGPGKYIRFVLPVAFVGWLIDSTLGWVGVFSFPEAGSSWWPAPIWMAALWANFAGTLHLCLDWLRGRYGLAAVLGAVGGPLAYYGGHRLGAMELADGITLSLAIIALEWAVVTPGLVYVSTRPGLDGLRTAPVEKAASRP